MLCYHVDINCFNAYFCWVYMMFLFERLKIWYKIKFLIKNIKFAYCTLIVISTDIRVLNIDLK